MSGDKPLCIYRKTTVDSLAASTRGLKLVDQKRRQKRWNKTAQVWCREAFTTRSTLNRFWAGKPIRRETFIAICQAVGVDWEDVVERTHDLPATESPDCLQAAAWISTSDGVTFFFMFLQHRNSPRVNP
jgi:DNA-binding Xre family transcriptional regulator